MNQLVAAGARPPMERSTDWLEAAREDLEHARHGAGLGLHSHSLSGCPSVRNAEPAIHETGEPSSARLRGEDP